MSQWSTYSLFFPVENAYRLLPLAHEFQIQEIVDQCESCIMSKDLTIPNVQLADDYGLAKLRSACIRHVGTYYPRLEIIGSEHYKRLSEKSRFDLLSMRIATLESKFNDGQKLQSAASNSSGCYRGYAHCSNCAGLDGSELPSKQCTKKELEFYKNLFG